MEQWVDVVNIQSVRTVIFIAITAYMNTGCYVWIILNSQKYYFLLFNICFVCWTRSLSAWILPTGSRLNVRLPNCTQCCSSLPPCCLHSASHLSYLILVLLFFYPFSSSRYYFKFPNNLCQQVWPSDLWSKINLHPLCDNLVHHWFNRCPAFWPPVCVQRHSGKSTSISLACLALFLCLFFREAFFYLLVFWWFLHNQFE